MNFIGIILWIVIGVWINKMYHRLFHIVYFGEGGIIRELAATAFVSGMITVAILEFFGNIFN